ncbi:hypothetical protein AB0C81_28725 [Streptomyces roseoverticillatus]|uniref:hypothetical protein n=1 Tax=Streptomyces roseoverticillatus TaxID=66429 RepID=UPI0033C20FBB
MKLRTPESRCERGTALAGQIAEIVYRGGRRYAFPYLILLDIRDILADPETEAETALAQAVQKFRNLYAAPRDGFSEFYVHDSDPDQMEEENQRFEELVSELRSALHDS